eukprot:359786-Chlamydomonas_euryale.AAC.3
MAFACPLPWCLAWPTHPIARSLAEHLAWHLARPLPPTFKSLSSSSSLSSGDGSLTWLSRYPASVITDTPARPPNEGVSPRNMNAIMTSMAGVNERYGTVSDSGADASAVW